MPTKHIQNIFSPPPPHMVGDGFRVHNFIPSSTGSFQRMEPFIMLDYNAKFTFPPSNSPKGVGVHPHKGFETVTIAYKGKIAHKDSSGAGGVIGEGDVQWMTAGAGVLHKEFHEEEFSRQGGEFQMVQLWVNLPKADKLTSPKYQELTSSNIPVIHLPEQKGTIRVIAGQHKEVTGAADTFSEVHLLDVALNKNAKESFFFAPKNNTALLVIEGSIIVNSTDQVEQDHFVLFENIGEEFEVQATSDNAKVLILSAAPINEPIVAQGPFVMNTKAEIIEAFEEYTNGKFGTLD